MLGAQPAVGGDAAGQHDALDAVGHRRSDRRLYQHIDDRFLKACGDIGLVSFRLFLALLSL